MAIWDWFGWKMAGSIWRRHSIRAGMRSHGGPGSAAVQLLAEMGWPSVPNLAEQNWRGTPTLTRQARRRAAERLFLIGDAAGYIEPFTGEGMAWALAAGQAVAPLAARAVQQWQPQYAPQWEARSRRLLGRRQAVCRVVAAVLRWPRMTRTPVLAAGQKRQLLFAWRASPSLYVLLTTLCCGQIHEL